MEQQIIISVDDVGTFLNVVFTVRPLCVSDEEFKPSYYKLKDDDTRACLATGFSRHNATQDLPLFSGTDAARISEDKLYNQVALISSDQEEEQCEDGKSERQITSIIRLNEQKEIDEKWR